MPGAFPSRMSFDGISLSAGLKANCSSTKAAISCSYLGERWCRFLRQGHKVDRPMERTIQHEDTQTVYGRVQGQGCA